MGDDVGRGDGQVCVTAEEIAALRKQTQFIIDLIEDARRRWTFGADQDSHAYAASALVRVGALLREALELAATSPSIGASILVRAAVETWIVGAGAHFEGLPAVLAFTKERIDHETRLLEAISQNDDVEEGARNKLERDRRVIDELAEREGWKLPPASFWSVVRRLEDSGIEEAAGASRIYADLYRPVSTWDAHPYKVVDSALERGPNGLTSIRAPSPWREPHEHIARMAMYAGILGRWIDVQAGTACDAWNEAVEAVVATIG